jgi:hypothetical protein
LPDGHFEVQQRVGPVAGHPADHRLAWVFELGDETRVDADGFADQPGGAVQGSHAVERAEQRFTLAEQPVEHRGVLGGPLLRDVPLCRHAPTIAHSAAIRIYQTFEGVAREARRRCLEWRGGDHG